MEGQIQPIQHFVQRYIPKAIVFSLGAGAALLVWNKYGNPASPQCLQNIDLIKKIEAQKDDCMTALNFLRTNVQGLRTLNISNHHETQVSLKNVVSGLLGFQATEQLFNDVNSGTKEILASTSYDVKPGMEGRMLSPLNLTLADMAKSRQVIENLYRTANDFNRRYWECTLDNNELNIDFRNSSLALNICLTAASNLNKRVGECTDLEKIKTERNTAHEDKVNLTVDAAEKNKDINTCKLLKENTQEDLDKASASLKKCRSKALLDATKIGQCMQIKETSEKNEKFLELCNIEKSALNLNFSMAKRDLDTTSTLLEACKTQVGLNTERINECSQLEKTEEGLRTCEKAINTLNPSLTETNKKLKEAQARESTLKHEKEVCDNFTKQLTDDYEVMKKERDFWKKKYDDWRWYRTFTGG